jgi:hypothetical protein
MFLLILPFYFRTNLKKHIKNPFPSLVLRRSGKEQAETAYNVVSTNSLVKP